VSVGSVDLGAVLVTGLFAGGISCAAVQGGLLTGLVARQRGTAPAGTVPAGHGPTRARAPRTRPAARPAPERDTRTVLEVLTGRSAGYRVRAKAAADRTKAATARAEAATARSNIAGRRGGVTAATKLKPADARHTPQVTRRARAAALPRPWHAQLGDDLVPVGAFLAGKLLAYTLLGALLGALGSVVQLSPAVRVWTQLGAGALIVCFGLAQLGVRSFQKFTIAPPASWTRFVRGRARSQAAFAPALLGLATVLVPCAITLTMEVLALNSGSPLSGAAVMAVFVLGTSPLFAILGYAVRRAATVWSGRLALATGLVVLGLGMYTFNAGLTLAGSPFAAVNLAQTLGFSTPPAVSDPAVVHMTTDGHQEAIITVRPGSYSPANILLRSGVPTTLILRGDGATGCTSAMVINGSQYIVPPTGDTPVDLGVLKPGTLRYTCAMGMYSGQLTIRTPPPPTIPPTSSQAGS
jgi:uncharacterized protein